MKKETLVEIKMDSETLDTVQSLYKELGTSFEEAVRIFAIQSLSENGFPFVPRKYEIKTRTAKGLLSKYASEESRKKEMKAFMEMVKAEYQL